MACLAPLCIASRRRRIRVNAPPTVQQAACWIGICRPLDEHEPDCPREPTELERAQALLHWKLRQRRLGR